MTKRILFFSRDPGAANCIIPVFKRMSEMNHVTALLYGKEFALASYEREGLSAEDIGSVISDTKSAQQFLEQIRCDMVVTGTSSNDFTDRYAWEGARNLGIPSVALLDQWMNYSVRFSFRHPGETLYNTIEILPDLICVPDDLAKKEMIEEKFPEERIAVTGNPYFETLIRRVSEARAHRGQLRERLHIEKAAYVVSFISEPIVESYKDPLVKGYTQFTILSEILSSLSRSSRNKKVTLLIRLHPRNKQDLMEKFLATCTISATVRVLVDDALLPEEVIAISDLMTGISSVLLIEGSIVHTPILSIQIGLKGKDPFVLTRAGYTKIVQTPEELDAALQRDFSGDNVIESPYTVDLNATERIISRIQSLL